MRAGSIEGSVVVISQRTGTSYEGLCTEIPQAANSRRTAARLVSGRWPRLLGDRNTVVVYLMLGN
jgi:hypothetical protein